MTFFTEQEQFVVIGRGTMRIHFIETHSSNFFRWYVLMSVVGLFAINTSVVADVSAHAQQPSPITSKLKKMTLETDLVPGSVNVHLLMPPDDANESEPMPLMLWLHGGGGDDSSYLTRELRPRVEQAWRRSELPPMVIVVPSARRSFYMDFESGTERWETFVLSELLPTIRAKYNVSQDRTGTFIGGYSMGGVGSLRMAFKNPDKFSVVAAIAPAIEPTFRFEEIAPRDRSYRSDAFYERFFGQPVNTHYWEQNHPPTLARDRASQLSEAKLNIYFEAGDEDELGLFRGAEFLHRALLEKNVPHEYRLIRGARHGGESMPGRLSDALRYVGRVSEMLKPTYDPRLDQIIRKYTELFNAGEAEAIASEIYSEPVMIIDPTNEKHFILETQEQIADHGQAVFRAIKSEGWDHSVVHDTSIRMTGPDMAMVSLKFSRFNEKGDVIPPGEHLGNYILLRTSSGWRVIMACSQRASGKFDSDQVESVIHEKMDRYVDLLNGNDPANGVAEEIYQFPGLSRSFLGAREHKAMFSKSEFIISLRGYLDGMKSDGMTAFTANDMRVFPMSEKLVFVERISSRIRADGSPIPPAQTPFTYIWVKNSSGWKMVATLAQGSRGVDQSSPR